MKKYALISVSDKSRIEKLVKFLVKEKYTLLATDGTYRYLKSKKINSIKISKFTKLPELLNGRVKTLSHKIFSGILADKEKNNHVKELSNLKYSFIDIVIVNCYPFKEIVLEKNHKEEEAIENIDIGGISLLRAAAKNYKNVIILSSPQQYENFIIQMKNDGLNLNYRKNLAAAAFKFSCIYDCCISNYLMDKIIPDEIYDFLNFKSITNLSYGENPHQQGKLINTCNDRITIKQISGKPVSYNNINDIDNVMNLLENYNRNNNKAFCIISKHTNPCGCGIDSKNISNAFKKALTCDPQSAFGGIIGINKPLNIQLAKLITNAFYEVVLFKSAEEAAIEFIKQKKPNLRLIKYKANKKNKNKISIKNVNCGLLIQTKDILNKYEKNVCVTKKKLSIKQAEMLKLAWIICGHVKSNSVVIVKNNKTIGIGAGQMSRVDSVKIAISNAQKYGHSLQGAVIATDGFFPFKDSIELLHRYGIKSVISPGGSIRDQEVIDCCNKHKMSMVFTGVRHFLH